MERSSESLHSIFFLKTLRNRSLKNLKKGPFKGRVHLRRKTLTTCLSSSSGPRISTCQSSKQTATIGSSVTPSIMPGRTSSKKWNQSGAKARLPLRQKLPQTITLLGMGQQAEIWGPKTSTLSNRNQTELDYRSYKEIWSHKVHFKAIEIYIA